MSEVLNELGTLEVIYEPDRSRVNGQSQDGHQSPDSGDHELHDEVDFPKEIFLTAVAYDPAVGLHHHLSA